MADNKLELVIEIDANRANASIKSVNAGLSSIEQTAAKTARGASAGIDGLTISVAKGAAAGTLLANALQKALGYLREYGAEIVSYAARTETLTVVTQQLGRVNNYQGDALARLVGRLKELGISTQEAHGVVQRMIFAQLDLSKATDLARVAQDAAVISGVNSSEALENIILGITTGQTRLLHNMGLQVSLEQTIQEEERRLGRAISETEKRAAMFNKVLQEGVKIQGSYEAAMQTAGKQVTSLTRYWQEAKNALGQQFLPEMRKVVSGLTDLAKWAKENADVIAAFARGIGSAAIGVAVAKFIGWMAGAKRAVDGLRLAMVKNPLTAAAVAASIASTALYEYYQHTKEADEQLKEHNKTAEETRKILAEVGRGKTVEQLQMMGYSVEQIRKAFLGAHEGAEDFLETYDKAAFAGQFKIINEQERLKQLQMEAAERARDMAKKQKELQRETLEDAIKAERALLTGPVKLVHEIEEKARKASVFVDAKGVEYAMKLTAQTRENLEREFHAKVRALQKESIEDEQKRRQDAYQDRLRYEWDLYQARASMEAQISQRRFDHAKAAYEFGEQRAGMERDAQLRALEAADAQTLRQKVAAEQRRMEIEVEYLQKTHAIKMGLFDVETSTQVLQFELEMKRLGMQADVIASRVAELRAERQALRDQQEELAGDAVAAARENATIRQTQLIRDEQRRIFDSLKQQAGGVFDALLQRSQSVWSAIGNSLKTALLTAIKDVATSRVAAMLMQLLTGTRVSLAGGGRGGGGFLAGLGGLAGFGATPVFGAAGGGLGLGGTPPFLPVGYGAGGGGGARGATGGAGSLFSGAGMAGSLAGLKDFLGIGGSIQTGAGMATTWGAATMGQKLSAIGKSNAALMGGAMLAMDGLRRGGKLGLAETTAGGALIGFKYGGPLGAVIGGIAGAVAGTIRLFVKGAQEKAREKIKATYGVDIPDKGLLKQIVDTAKQAYGGNLDMAIRSQEIRDLVEIYAMSTGQKPTGMLGTVRPTTLAQVSGSLYQQSAFSSGSPLPSSGGLLTVDSIGAGAPSHGSTMVVQLDGPATTALLRGEAVQAIADSPRAVVKATVTGMRANSGRRQMAALQLTPGLLTT